ncbi:acyl-CoA synthetase [Natrinema saccharevitans]|uniref:Acyl-CoA synthetase n=1 Tax=Natrinema saccharevitans TaxID=301967 RepID=A0A1S8AWJ8_9EURY|nr:AMP-binding protein [Natrinema saccharevitans]OLZ41065.1 acyl-CoA synthetase [Natrinema saccharevitans]
MTNFVTELRSSIRNDPEATAIDCEDPMTFSQLWSAMDSFAGGLQEREITAGDRIAIHVADPRPVLVAAYGALRAGCVPVTLPAAYENRDVRRVLSDTGAAALVTDSSPIMPLLTGSEPLRVAITVDSDTRMGVSFTDFVDNDGMNGSNSRTGIDIVRRADEAPALIAYVDRDERPPVAAAYTHASLNAAASARPGVPGDGSTPLESHRSALPLSDPIEFAHGANATLTDGGRYRPIAAADRTTLRSLLVTTEAERTFVTPGQYRDLRSNGGVDDGGLRVVESTRATFGTEDGDPGDAVRLCGLPETGLTHVRTPADVASGSIGDPLPGIRARVVDDGAGDELAVTGTAVRDDSLDPSSPTDEQTVTIDGTRWVRTGVPACSERGEIRRRTDADPVRPTTSR